MVLKNNWVGWISSLSSLVNIFTCSEAMDVDSELSDAARPSRPSSPEQPMGGVGEQDDSIKSMALSFWRAFVSEDAELCGQALRRLSEAGTTNDTLLREIAGTTLRGRRELEGGDGDTGGKSTRPVGRLSAAQQTKVVDCWVDRGTTSLVLLDSRYFCLAFDGDMKNVDPDTKYYIACAQRSGSSPDSCTTGTHRESKRIRMILTTPSFAVRLRTISAATRPKVFAGCLLPENEIPRSLIQNEFSTVLETLEARPAAWFHVVRNRPSLATLNQWLDERSARERSELSLGQLRRETGLPKTATSRGSDSDNEDSGDDDDDTSTPSGHTAGQQRGRGSSGGNGASLSDSDDDSDSTDPIEKKCRRCYLECENMVEGFKTEIGNDMITLKTDLSQQVEFVTERLGFVENVVRGHTQSIGDLRLRTLNPPRPVPATPAAPSPPIRFEELNETQKDDLADRILDLIDVSHLLRVIQRRVDFTDLTSHTRDLEARVGVLEDDFSEPQGVIRTMQDKIEEAEARRNIASSVRANYTFRDQSDVEALVAMDSHAEFFKYFLDIVSCLALAKESFVSYTEGIKVHADAIKANFKTVLGSKIKLSFETPLPEIFLRTPDTKEAASQGGAVWAPKYATAGLFEDALRTGSHREISAGVDKVFDLMMKQVENDFPVRHFGPVDAASVKINHIIMDHNRMAHRQTIAFIESILPIHRTFTNGGMSAADAWDRTKIYVVEFFQCIQEVRLVSLEATSSAAMIWGSMKATDLAEEFKKQKFIEHPKVVSILALTSIEREGKAISDALKDLKADKESIAKIERRVQALETTNKNLRLKNPDVKW